MKNWREGWKKRDKVFYCENNVLYCGIVEKVYKNNNVLYLLVKLKTWKDGSMTYLYIKEYGSIMCSKESNLCGKTPQEAVEISCNNLKKLLGV